MHIAVSNHRIGTIAPGAPVSATAYAVTRTLQPSGIEYAAHMQNALVTHLSIHATAEYVRGKYLEVCHPSTSPAPEAAVSTTPHAAWAWAVGLAPLDAESKHADHCLSLLGMTPTFALSPPAISPQ